MIDIFFLGTGATKPTLERAVSGIIVRTNKTSILLDCGETTQIQLMKLGINPMKISLIVVSHLHGDHFFGLPGLLQTMDLLQRKTPITITGPKGILDYLKFVQKITTTLTYPVVFQPIEKHKQYSHKDVVLTHALVNHSVESYATLISLIFKTGKFLPERAKEEGIPKGPFWKDLKNGKSVTLENGRIILPQKVTEDPPDPLKIVYSSDTRPCQSLEELTTGATVLIHDSTYSTEEKSLAELTMHSTAKQAAKTAQEVGVHQLFLTHISARYKQITSLLEEAKTVFPNTIIPDDLSGYRIGIDKKTLKPRIKTLKLQLNNSQVKLS
ncbi:MAG: ribonuclease Z [Candidatus Ranarchaeia archaeon]